jgi:acyl-CoA thioesterase I
MRDQSREEMQMLNATCLIAKPVAAPRAARRMYRYLGFAFAVFNVLLTVVHADVMAQSAPQGAAKPITIVAFGDSLSAGYQLPASDAFPAQLEKALRAKGYAVSVINAGVSGDTTAAGLDRLTWAVPPEAEAVIVELGANDALRGQDPSQARSNLDKIITTLKVQKQEVLIAGMVAPTSLPGDYRKAFDTIFPDLAEKHGTLLYPFFLDGIALDAKLNLADGLHPNSQGVAVIVQRILPKAEDLIARVQKRRAGTATTQ